MFVIDRVWVSVLVVTLVSLSKTLNHYCCVLQVGLNAVGHVGCSIHGHERTQCTYHKEKRAKGPCVPGFIGAILHHSTLYTITWF